MRLTVELDQQTTPGIWRQVDPAGPEHVETALPPSQWSERAQAAMQRGLTELNTRLTAVGLPEATVELEITAEDDRADVKGALRAGQRRVVRNTADPSLRRAIQDALKQLEDAVDRGLLDQRAAPPEDSDADRLTRAIHRYAQHVVLLNERRGVLPPGRIDPRDVAEEALAARLEKKDQPLDLGVDLPSLRAWIDAWIDRKLERVETNEDARLEAFVGSARDADMRPPESEMRRAADEIGEVDPIDDDAERAVERARLGGALFDLPPEQKYLFAEVVVDGFPVDAVAAARGIPEETIEARLREATIRLAKTLDRDDASVIEAYTALGETLRAERKIAAVPHAAAGR